MACMDPRGTVGSIYKGEYYTLVHTTYENSVPYGFREDFFLCFSHDALGVGPAWTPGAWLAGFVAGYFTLLHTKYESFGPCGFGEEDFFKFFPMTPPGRGAYGPQGHGWQDL